MQQTTKKKTILIVEDDANDIVLLKRVLRSVQMDNPTISLNTISEVESYIDSCLNKEDTIRLPIPGVIFVDPGLPDGNALSYIKRWKSRLGKETLFVVLTGCGQENSLQASYLAGADSFLVKPITSGEVDNVVTFYQSYFFDPAPENQPTSVGS